MDIPNQYLPIELVLLNDINRTLAKNFLEESVLRWNCTAAATLILIFRMD
jgi:hypothetical protein